MSAYLHCANDVSLCLLYGQRSEDLESAACGVKLWQVMSTVYNDVGGWGYYVWQHRVTLAAGAFY